MMTEAEIKRVVSEAVEETLKAEIKRVVSEAVEETLTKLGVQVDDPIEVQKDMGFLRSWRTSTAAIGRHGMLTAVGVVVVGLLGLIWLSIKGGQP